jgi:hypothetical protein
MFWIKNYTSSGYHNILIRTDEHIFILNIEKDKMYAIKKINNLYYVTNGTYIGINKKN